MDHVIENNELGITDLNTMKNVIKTWHEEFPS